MKIDLLQNTPEWYEYRKNKIGASDIPIIMGSVPFMTERDLFLIKTGKKVQKETPVMTYGKEKEEFIRQKVSLDLGVHYETGIFICDHDHRFMASCDGVNPAMDELIEIKTMGKKLFDCLLVGGIPTHYYQQMQWQMMCSGIRFGHLVAFCRDTERMELRPVTWDSTMIDTMIAKAKIFLQKLDNNRSVDNFFYISDAFDLQEIELLNIDRQISELKAQIYELDKQREKLHGQLLDQALLADVKETNFYKVIKQIRKGKLDEEKLLQVVPNLDDFRSEEKQTVFLKRKQDEQL